VKQIATVIFVAASLQSASAGELDSITFEWQWNAGNTDYTAGPEGDIVFDLYMRTEDDAGYDFDYPTISGIDDCWLDGDLYRCQATLQHTFEPGVHYFFSVAAYLIDDQESASTLSNEIEYIVEDSDNTDLTDTPNPNSSALSSGEDDANTGSGSSTAVSAGTGGGCFIDISLTQ
jgi:hypothetical protein